MNKEGYCRVLTDVKERQADRAPKSAMPGIHVVAKPIGPMGNPDCECCFYLGKQVLFNAHEKCPIRKQGIFTPISICWFSSPDGKMDSTRRRIYS